MNTEIFAFGIPNPLFAVTLPTITPYSAHERVYMSACRIFKDKISKNSYSWSRGTFNV